MELKPIHFQELSLSQLYNILKTRAEVFVVEQNIIYNDMDNKDESSYHLFIEESGEVISYLRIIPAGISYDEVSIGRVATKSEYRGKGLSRKLLIKAIEFIINDMKEDKIKISAQAYLKSFYESLGFKAISDIYIEEGIEHIKMVYNRYETKIDTSPI